MRLEVARLHDSEQHWDSARVPNKYRLDKNERLIPEGSVCQISIANKSVLVVIWNQTDNPDNPAMYIDETTMDKLGVKRQEQVDVRLTPVHLIGNLRWALGATNPAYRIAAQLAILSVVLGAAGMIAGLAVRH